MSRFRSFRRQILSFLYLLAITLGLVLSSTSPALAGVTVIETTAPLPDHSEQAIRTAVMEAAEIAVQGAVAMGLSWVQVRQVYVLADMVTIQILATDTEPEGVDTGELGPDEEHDLRASEPERFDL